MPTRAGMILVIISSILERTGESRWTEGVGWRFSISFAMARESIIQVPSGRVIAGELYSMPRGLLAGGTLWVDLC